MRRVPFSWSFHTCHIFPIKTYKPESFTLICFTLSPINLDIIKAQIEPCVQEMNILMHETADSYFRMIPSHLRYLT